ncbi:purine nucleoside transporter PunC [Ferrimonas balearica]|uniref:purine nucleoside transporter PunC n=1 Tax=Ferrimonas balearica TaxID=44012 RepID=UPI001C998EDB|nr:purine nucleoside transporter PunC [Ferrimonas balearica]MBY5992885.1 Bcr/CflA family multidrug efflux MFS transporter [Ferrimonas balearica]
MAGNKQIETKAEKIPFIELLYLAGLSMMAFVATDMYLPAFKVMEGYYGTGPESIALSLSVFLAGLAGGQLLWGLASDRFGRRTTLMAGLVLYTLASLGLTFSDSVWQLLSLRFVQAIGVCAPAVIWQALVIDRYPGARGQQVFATIMPLVALSPALAPQLGVGLTLLLGWQSIFLALTAIGLVWLWLTWRLPKDQPAASQRSVRGDIAGLLRSRVYLGNVVIFGAASAAFFAYLTGMPEIMASLGYDARQIGLSFVPQTIAFMLGGYLGKRLVARHGDAPVLKGLLVMFSVAAGAITLVSQLTLTSIWPVLLPFCFLAVTNGALYPIVVNRALSSAPHCAATAAGLQNSLQIAISFGASAVVAALASIALPVTGVAIGLSALVVVLGALWAGSASAPQPALATES